MKIYISTNCRSSEEDYIYSHFYYEEGKAKPVYLVLLNFIKMFLWAIFSLNFMNFNKMSSYVKFTRFYYRSYNFGEHKHFPRPANIQLNHLMRDEDAIQLINSAFSGAISTKNSYQFYKKSGNTLTPIFIERFSDYQISNVIKTEIIEKKIEETIHVSDDIKLSLFYYHIYTQEGCYKIHLIDKRELLMNIQESQYYFSISTHPKAKFYKNPFKKDKDIEFKLCSVFAEGLERDFLIGFKNSKEDSTLYVANESSFFRKESTTSIVMPTNMIIKDIYVHQKGTLILRAFSPVHQKVVDYTIDCRQLMGIYKDSRLKFSEMTSTSLQHVQEGRDKDTFPPTLSQNFPKEPEGDKKKKIDLPAQNLPKAKDSAKKPIKKKWYSFG